MSKRQNNQTKTTKKTKKNAGTPDVTDNTSQLLANDAKNAEMRWQRHQSTGRRAIESERFEEAVQEFSAALKFAERLNDFRIANTFADLGYVSMRLNQYELARDFFSRALRVRQTIYGASDASVAIEFNNLAMTYEWQRDYVPAKAFLEKAVDILDGYAKIQSLNHAEPYENLAELYMSGRDFVRAQQACLKALAIREDLAGLLHPITLKTLECLVRIQEASGLAKQAAETRKDYDQRLREYSCNTTHGASAKLLRQFLEYKDSTIEKNEADARISEFIKLVASR